MKKLAIITILFLFVFSGCGQTSTEEQDNTAKAEAFLDQIVNEEYEAARENFDETMDSNVSAEGLEEIWVGLTTQVGAFQKHTDSRLEEDDGYQMVYLTCAFEKETLDMRVVFDEEGQIAGLQFVPVSTAE